MPPSSRYRFLLDDARFYIEGFIKGPVCRGQVALNVIEDRFWILFFDPTAPIASNRGRIDELADMLALPSELGNTLRLITTYGHYLKLENQYLAARRKSFSAGLTVFRHHDSASVQFGLVGENPETAWVLDYPLLERIHYLLVAGFDVYGNVGHQLNTRLHMDILRMEAENFLLAFLPAKVRKRVHDEWYQGIRRGDEDDVQVWWEGVDFVTGYQTNDPLAELFQHLKGRLGSLASTKPARPCAGQDCASVKRERAIEFTDRRLAELSQVHGRIVEFAANVAFIQVELGGDPHNDLAYTLLTDKSYANVSSMFSDQERGHHRAYSRDEHTVVPWLEGSYPEFFFVVKPREVERFVRDYGAITNHADFERFIARFGVRRTDSRFGRVSDWFRDHARREQPLRAGIFDLNRYMNR